MIATIRRTVHGPSARRAQVRRRRQVEGLEGRQLLSAFAAPDVSLTFTKIEQAAGVSRGNEAVHRNHIGIHVWAGAEVQDGDRNICMQCIAPNCPQSAPLY